MTTERRWLVDEVLATGLVTWIRIVPVGSYGDAEEPPKVNETLRAAGDPMVNHSVINVRELPPAAEALLALRRRVGETDLPRWYLPDTTETRDALEALDAAVKTLHDSVAAEVDRLEALSTGEKPESTPHPAMGYSERGFAQFDPTKTSYGAEVKIAESSSAEGPYLWMFVEQPEPARPGELERKLGEVGVHMSLDQAEEIHDKLGAAIKFMKDARGWV